MIGLDTLDRAVFGNSLLHWLAALAVLVTVFVLLRLVKLFVGRRVARLATTTETQVDDIAASVINSTRFLFLAAVSLILAAQVLELHGRVQTVVHSAFIIALLAQSGIWLSVVAKQVLAQYRQRTAGKDPAAATTIAAMGFLSRIVIWSIVVLMVLDNLGFDVTALVAGLGIGGVAVALAVQNILGDLFASLSIILDKPFVIGDFLIVGEYMGSVEYVGLKTTRMRSLSGEQLIFSNSDLLGSRIRNYGRMYERRVVFNLGVTYDTPREKLREIPGIIRAAVEARDRTRFDRSHFMQYGDYALKFETVYYVKTPDYNIHMDIQQSIYLDIHAAFEEKGIEFAYPTQKLLVENQ